MVVHHRKECNSRCIDGGVRRILLPMVVHHRKECNEETICGLPPEVSSLTMVAHDHKQCDDAIYGEGH